MLASRMAVTAWNCAKESFEFSKMYLQDSYGSGLQRKSWRVFSAVACRQGSCTKSKINHNLSDLVYGITGQVCCLGTWDLRGGTSDKRTWRSRHAFSITPRMTEEFIKKFARKWSQPESTYSWKHMLQSKLYSCDPAGFINLHVIEIYI